MADEKKSKDEPNALSEQGLKEELARFRREIGHIDNCVITPSRIPNRDRELWRDTVRYQFIYSLVGLLLGLVSMIGGIILFLHGVTGSTSWVAKGLGLQSSISDAAPGAILFIVGLFVIIATRFVVKSHPK
ncbi:MAG TPA: hypothetical protein VGB77_09890 [Abditibacteriaceae bacterium]|jgi:hypothetical protein